MPDILNPRHECGHCDGLLEYAGGDIEIPQWCCTDCGEWHTSEDCCVNPEVHEGDRIRLVSMPNDPDPVPTGSLATVTGVVCYSQSQPKHMDQIQVVWDNGRTLNLAPVCDRYELDDTPIIQEEEDMPMAVSW